MIHSISHQTDYDFETTPQSVVQRLHLTPLERPYQKVLEWEVLIEGGATELEANDYHGNRVHLCHHDLEAGRIRITSRGRVEVDDISGVVGMHDNQIPIDMFRRQTSLTQPGALLGKLVAEMEEYRSGGEHDDIESLHELSSKTLKRIKYSKGKTDADTTAEEAMKLGKGVCQDHVHAFLAVARTLGYPARYVSGYLMVEGEPVQEASHAWAEVHVDPLGWVGFDISNIISPDDRYVKLATGFDYADVVPIAGVKFGSGDETLTTQITVNQQ